MTNSTAKSCKSATEPTDFTIEHNLPSANAADDGETTTVSHDAQNKVISDCSLGLKESQSLGAKIMEGGGKWLPLEVKRPACNEEKQHLIRAIRHCAEKLRRVPSQFELGQITGITRKDIQKHFVNYRLALRECGLEPAGARQNLETLFRDWSRITRELGRTPTAAEYAMRSQFGEHPLTQRFGGWRAATQGMLLYAKERDREDELKGIIETPEEKHWSDAAVGEESFSGLASGRATELNRLQYGESLNPLPMAHGPRNETGVVFAFGMLAKKLGFVIQFMQTAFPDCEALRWVAGGWWERVRIEIEYQSFNFVKHRHDPKGCDLIVCWEHNWPECPVEVLELRKVVMGAR